QTSRPRIGVFPSINGESWLGVLVTSNSPLFTTNQAQPEPKRVVAAFANSSLNASKLPNLLLIASANSPAGAPPPFGERIVQNRLWFACPPPLFLTAVRISSGTASRLEIKSSTDLLSRSAFPAIALFTFVMYVLWCLV